MKRKFACCIGTILVKTAEILFHKIKYEQNGIYSVQGRVLISHFVVMANANTPQIYCPEWEGVKSFLKY